MGRQNRYIKVGGLRFLQALTPREHHSRFLIASPSGPLSRHRERGWGERADTPVATLGAILCAVRIDFGLPSKINPYPAQPATGVLGQSPKRVLVPFTRVKGTPRRRAVQIVTQYKTCPADRREETMIKWLRGGWGAGLIFAEERPAAGRRKVPQSSCFVRLCSGRFCTIIE